MTVKRGSRTASVMRCVRPAGSRTSTSNAAPSWVAMAIDHGAACAIEIVRVQDDASSKVTGMTAVPPCNAVDAGSGRRRRPESTSSGGAPSCLAGTMVESACAVGTLTSGAMMKAAAIDRHRRFMRTNSGSAVARLRSSGDDRRFVERTRKDPRKSVPADPPITPCDLQMRRRCADLHRSIMISVDCSLVIRGWSPARHSRRRAGRRQQACDRSASAAAARDRAGPRRSRGRG